MGESGSCVWILASHLAHCKLRGLDKIVCSTYVDGIHVLLSSGIEPIENLTNDQMKSKLFRCATIEMFAVIAFDFIKANL